MAEYLDSATIAIKFTIGGLDRFNATTTYNSFATPALVNTASGSLSLSTKDATVEASEPLFTSQDQSVWVKFTCPASGWYKFWASQDYHWFNGNFGGDQAHIQIAILPDGALTAMTPGNALANSRGRNGFWSEYGDVVAAAELTAGNVYYIRVFTPSYPGYHNSYVQDFEFYWTSFTPPANDDFADATVISATLPQTVADQTTTDATFELGTESLDNAYSMDSEQSVWYKFTPSASGRYRFRIPRSSLEVDAAAAYQNRLTMQLSTGTTLATFQAGEIATTEMQWYANGDPYADNADIVIDLVGTQQYYLRVYTRYAQKTGTDGNYFNKYTLKYDLQVHLLTPPANDNYADAIAISTTLPNTITGTTENATEETGEASLPYTYEQSVWYKFTPTVTGQYRFRIPRNSLVYRGYSGVGNEEVAISIAPANGLANHIDANTLPGGWPYYDYTAASMGQNPDDAWRIVTLTSGVEYRIKITSGATSLSNFNQDVCEFDLSTLLIQPPTGDNFANAIAISGASGTQDFMSLGSTVEANEPVNFYWNDDGTGAQTRGTIWLTWTCPTSGWYKFDIQTLDEYGFPSYDLAIYTGSALNALTRINNQTENSHPPTIAPRVPSTALGFNAVSGTTYKIQITGWGNETEILGSRLSWASMSAPTGDTTATAITAPFNGRTNNYGNTDDELPPNFATLLSGHAGWWYNVGGAGKSKWFCYTAPEDVAIRIRCVQYLDAPSAYVEDSLALIAYKGADYASLAVAQAYNTDLAANENVAMMLENNTNYGSPNVEYWQHLTTRGDASSNPIPTVNLTAGEKLWVCVFGLYDDDVMGDTSVPAGPIDAQESDFDLYFDAVPPNVDTLPAAIAANQPWAYPTYEADLTKTKNWPNDLVYELKLAGEITGVTHGATAQPGEPAHAGYGPTRSVWYIISLQKQGNHKIWVESDQDCVLSVYEYTNYPTMVNMAVITEDDDSGVGNNPEVTVNVPGAANRNVWVCVDSKVPCTFSLRYEWINDSPVIPANNNFADAPAYTGPFTATGSTIGASAEYFEWESPWYVAGPADTVWYKYTPSTTGQIKIEGRVLTDNWDNFVIVEVYTGPDKDNLTRVSAENQGFIFYGPFSLNQSNDPIFLNVTSGTDYYIRVSSRHGESEDFEIWVDTDQIYINLQASGVETGPWAFTVPIKITPGGTEIYDPVEEIIDSGTVYVNIQVESSDIGPYSDLNLVYVNISVSSIEFAAKEYLDAATVYVGLEIDSHDCHTLFESTQLIAHVYRRFETTANYRWQGTRAYRRFEVVAGDGLEEC